MEVPWSFLDHAVIGGSERKSRLQNFQGLTFPHFFELFGPIMQRGRIEICSIWPNKRMHLTVDI